MTCKINDCHGQVIARGWCRKHYNRYWFHGNAEYEAPDWKTTHGYSKTSEYKTWQEMRRRCTDRSAKSWKYYGGRGIKVCRRWLKFENFIADMGRKPSPVHTIDRLDNNKGYEPGNCAWRTRKEQAANRRPAQMRLAV